MQTFYNILCLGYLWTEMERKFNNIFWFCLFFSEYFVENSNKRNVTLSLTEYLTQNYDKGVRPNCGKWRVYVNWRSDGLTVKQSDGRTVKLSDSQSVKRSNSQTVRRSNCQTVKLSEGQTVRRSNWQTVRYWTVRQSDGQASKLTQIGRECCMLFIKRQDKCCYFRIRFWK